MTASISTREGAAVGGPDVTAHVPPAPSPGNARPPVRDRLRPYVRPTLALLAVVIAYRVSLRTLLDDLALDTPLAHLALVPLVALGMMVAGSRRVSGPDIHDRQLDWIVGLPLVMLALAVNVVLPGHLSTEFWVYRVDLLSLPFFVAGVVVLMFGTRVAWRVRLGILFLFLAWPFPYSQVLDRWLLPFTAVTVRVVTAVVNIVNVARPYPGANSSALFTVTPRTGLPFDLSVATECSGANGLVGFSLVGLAFVLMLRGRKAGKALWLLAGGALVWALNVVRILLIFWIGQNWGQKVAIDGFHPYIGLVVFNLGILVMAMLLGRFGLRWGDHAAAGASAASPPPTYRPALAAGAIAVAIATLGVAVLNADLQNYDLVTSSLGSPRLVSFASSQERPDGWNLQYATRYDWSKRFFGQDSDWLRYIYTDPNAYAATGEQLHSNAAVIADVITTSDRGAFSAYGIEACYRFHNFKITRRQSVDLGNGVVGGLLTWYDPAARTTTTTLYWHWPIKNGDKTRWERVTLLVQDNPSLRFHNPRPPSESVTRDFQLQVKDVLEGGQGDKGAVSDRLVATRQYLVSFAQDMIALRTSPSVATQPAPRQP